MISFIVNNDDKKINIECSLNDSILNLKKEIIKKFNLNCNYVDIDFVLEKTMFGIFKVPTYSPSDDKKKSTFKRSDFEE